MEAVPETQKMDKFRVSAFSNQKVKESSHNFHQRIDEFVEKSSTSLKTTELTLPASDSYSMYSSNFSPFSQASPHLSRGHLRSRSSNGISTPPAMLRAQSMPGFNSSCNSLISPRRPASPRRVSAARIRSPRKFADEVFVGLPNRPTRTWPGNLGSPVKDQEISEFLNDCCSQTTSENSTSICSRQPNSHRITLPPKALSNPNLSPNSSFTTLNMHSSRSYDLSPHSNYCYSGSLSYPGSFSSLSIPSTPTSARSRSSSISSLETIPDSPDAEEAALEADRNTSTQVITNEIESIDEIKTKNPRDVIGGRGRLLGSGFGRDKRMRWSVCGAERRGDLNLHTIWED